MRFQSNEGNLPDGVNVSRAASGFNTSMRLTPRVNLPSVSHNAYPVVFMHTLGHDPLFFRSTNVRFGLGKMTRDFFDIVLRPDTVEPVLPSTMLSSSTSVSSRDGWRGRGLGSGSENDILGPRSLSDANGNCTPRALSWPISASRAASTLNVRGACIIGWLHAQLDCCGCCRVGCGL